jgi:nitrite reductase/ring-hydroxylating ferredoxin subunit
MDDGARQIRALVNRIGADQRLDRVAEPLSMLAERLTRRDDVKRTLSGSWLGHRLHPVLTDVPIGAWTSASLLDLLGGRSGRKVARRLVGVGIVASLPTALSGLSDWHDTHGESKRIGVVHAIANATGLALQVASWRARGRGHRLRGAALSGLGLGAVAAGGYLGGHLVFSQRVGVDAEVPTADVSQWRPVGRFDDLPDGEPRGVDVDGARVALVRRGDVVYAMAAVCSHAGGPLDEGCIRGTALQCPWHGSEFALFDGGVVRGPATTPQPMYDARVRDGQVEVRGPIDLDAPHASERVRFALASSG